jgi:hypothetical protein
MTRNIDNAQMLSAGKIQMSESKFNGDAAALFFL